MKLKTICSCLCSILVITSVCVPFTFGQKPIICQRQSENKNPLKYRIGSKYRPETAPSMLIVHISIDPKYFNREDMIALARQLNKDFSREKQLTAAICDEYKTAKSRGIIYDLLRREPPTALRGFYEIDRTTGKEGISFSTERGKPLDEVDIDLSKKP